MDMKNDMIHMKQGIGSTFWARRPPMELAHILKALIIERKFAALKTFALQTRNVKNQYFILK